MARASIQQLPQSLVNRIAAGEVIERPASVVKELVDNAIDAGATSIVVEIEDGGRELIRVIDNGCGIPPEELPLAMAPHATSKLRDDDDLFRIRTMGFRGEAIASIGSVSQMRILSRTPENDAAYEILNNGGQIGDPQAAAGNVGTTIEVRSLFFNVPARRKFLKGTQTELGHVGEMLVRLAIAHPDITFRLQHNGRTTKELPSTEPRTRLLAAWPGDFAEQCLTLDERDAELRITGLIGLPELASPVAKYQHLYVNRRPIRDKYVQHALREAYRGLTEPGRQPAAILLIDVPPGDVDVNVHPTKSEVRFKDGGRIHGLVMSAVRSTLLQHDLTPRAVPRADMTIPEPQRQTMQQRLADFFRTPAPAVTQEVLPMPERPLTPSPGIPGEGWGEGLALRDFPAPLARESAQPTFSPPPASPTPASVSPLGPYPSPLPLGTTGEGTDPPPPPVARPPAAPEPASKAIQLHNSYLVVESGDGMLVIDQHALHERIIYEDLLARFTRGPLESQRMLLPLTLKASPRQLDLINQVKPVLAKLGIEVEPFGPDAVAVQAFPSFLDRLEPVAFVQELLEKGEQELLDVNEEELLHEVLDMMSCKAAVKAGDPLTPQEIDALLARRELVDRSSNCPHGRPTTLRLSLKDLEKQFKRTGF